MRLRRNSGFGLLIMVMIIAVAGILLAALNNFLVTEQRETQLRIDRAKAQFLAQAAVMRAAWNWYVSTPTVEGTRRWATINTTVTGNQIFKAGLTSAAVYQQSAYAYYAPQAHTGITHVKNIATAASKAAGTTTLALTVPAAGVAQGNFVVLYLGMDDGGGALLNPPAIDTQGNTYATASDVTNAANVRTVIIYGIMDTALASGNTITARWTNNVTAKAMSAREFTGPTALDTQNTGSGTLPGNPITTTSITPSTPYSLVFGAVGTNGPSGDAFTQGAGYTLATEASTGNVSVAADVTVNGEYKIVTSSTAYVGDGTNSVNRAWSAACAAFVRRAQWATIGGNRRLRAWTIQNTNSTAGNNITIATMKVSWTGGGAAQLTGITLNNTSVWTGANASGVVEDITDTAITGNGGTLGGINTYLQWNNGGPADPTTVTVEFTYSGDSSTTDAKSHEVVLWDGAQTTTAGLPLERTFTVVGSGQVNQNAANKYFKVMESVKAVVSGAPGVAALEIMDWDDEDKSIP